MNHGGNALGVAAALVVASLGLWLVPKKAQPPEAPLEAPVPMQEWTADAGVLVLPAIRVVILGLPKPGPNQITKLEKCRPPAKFRDGGCWLAIADEVPPCDPPPGQPRNLWAEDKRCWFPVAEAKPPPTSGEPRRPGGVAGP